MCGWVPTLKFHSLCTGFVFNAFQNHKGNSTSFANAVFSVAVLVHQTQKSPIKCSSTMTLPYRQHMDPSVDTPGQEMRFETFLGPLVSCITVLAC